MSGILYIKNYFYRSIQLEESRVYINVGFKIDEDMTFEFYNFPSYKLTQIGNSEEDISIKLKEVKWYLLLFLNRGIVIYRKNYFKCEIYPSL